MIDDKKTSKKIIKEYEDTKLLKLALGSLNTNVRRLEEQFDVSFASNGNSLTIKGKNAKKALQVFDFIYNNFTEESEKFDIDYAISQTEKGNALEDDRVVIKTPRKSIYSKTNSQKELCSKIEDSDVVFVTGPAGTGKTYLSIAKAIEHYKLGKVKKIILTRPAVEAGEELGFLPGDLYQKLDPYLQPLYDALKEMLGLEQFNIAQETKDIEIVPFAYMRGRTFKDAFVVLDEAQNTSYTQLKLILTRIGVGSKLVIAGDLSQIDYMKHNTSGLKEVVSVVSNLDTVAIVEFSSQDSVRSKTAKQLVQAFEEYEEKFGQK